MVRLGLSLKSLLIMYPLLCVVDKAKELKGKQDALEDVNRRQEALAKLATEFEDVKPSITQICEKLVLFGEIWLSVSRFAGAFMI